MAFFKGTYYVLSNLDAKMYSSNITCQHIRYKTISCNVLLDNFIARKDCLLWNHLYPDWGSQIFTIRDITGDVTKNVIYLLLFRSIEYH